VYRLGQLSPYAYKTQYPISETFTLEVELDEGSIPEYRDNLCSFKNHDIDIEIKTKCTNDLIRKISRTGLILESFSLNGDIGSNLKVSMIYKNALNEADIFPALSTANSFFASQIITGENAKYINRSVNQEISLPVFEYCIPEYTGVLGHAQRRLNSGEFDG
jgi:hypothetical protein